MDATLVLIDSDAELLRAFPEERNSKEEIWGNQTGAWSRSELPR